MAKDYYELLGLNKDASRDEIKRAYKKLAKKYHPDINKEDGAADQFKEINEAATVLGDDQKRAQYDRFGTADFGPGGFHQGGGFDFSGDFGDLFESLFGSGLGRRQRRGPRRGSDLRYDLEIELEDAVKGITKHIIIPRYETCPNCKGTGADSEDAIITCPDCRGTGMVSRTQRTPFGMFQTTTTCRRCRGEGKTITNPCTTCDGAGRVEVERKLKVDVPPGVENGTTLRLGGQGEAGEKGARQGDLYVVVHMRPHKIFERRGNDLFIEVPLSFVTAVGGGSIEVPTILGKARLKIPAGTQSNTLFKMRDKGVPYLNSSSEGDQYVKTVVYTPESLNAKQKKALKDFAKAIGEKIEPQKGFFEKVKEKFV